MKIGFFGCEKHNSASRKTAFDAMPYASKLVAVCGGYIGFESSDGYAIWKNQK